jgi:hypothetical protein
MWLRCRACRYACSGFIPAARGCKGARNRGSARRVWSRCDAKGNDTDNGTLVMCAQGVWVTYLLTSVSTAKARALKVRVRGVGRMVSCSFDLGLVGWLNVSMIEFRNFEELMVKGTGVLGSRYHKASTRRRRLYVSIHVYIRVPEVCGTC